MKYKNKYRIESSRLKEWDYSTPWWYYVTICTKGFRNWFGEVKNGKIILNDMGKIVEEEWLKTKDIRANVDWKSDHLGCRDVPTGRLTRK